MEPLKFNPEAENVASSFEVSEERKKELYQELAQTWHEIQSPTPEFREKGLNLPLGLFKFASIGKTEEERILCAYSFGRNVGEIDKSGGSSVIATILSTLKGK